MILSVEVIDTVFRGLPVPDDVTKMYQPKQGCFPTTILRKGYGRKGLRRTAPLYNCWSNMFQRCLSGSSQQDKIKSYVGCNHMFSDYQDVDNVVVDFLMKFSLREWEKWTYHKWSCK